LKKVLLLGDSIRLSYQDRVKQKLEGDAEAWGPDDNGRFAKYTYWYCGKWAEECGGPDVIHWNNGIWDVYRQYPGLGLFTPLDEYIDYLGKILQRLKETNARIVWATSTPVKPTCENCSNEDLDRYNAEAVRFMTAEGVPINDLNALIRPDLDGNIDADHVHLSGAGVEACGEAVANVIRGLL